MQITVYTTTTCPYCKLLKDYLESRNLSYNEKLVDQDPLAKDEMMGISGGYLGVPFTVIKKDDGREIKIVGFDRTLIDKEII